MRVCLLGLLWACGGHAGPPVDEGCAVDAPVRWGDAANYRFEGGLAISGIETLAGADLQIDWGALTEDLQGHPVDPIDDIDTVALVLFPHLDEAGVMQGLEEGSLLQVDIGLYASLEVGERSDVQLSELRFVGNDIDVETQVLADAGTWLLTLNSGTQPAVGARTAVFFRPTANGTDTLGLADGLAVATVTAALEGLTALWVPAEGSWILDWSELGRDGRGRAFDPASPDLLTLGFYADADLASLEARFLDLALLADPAWSFDVRGSTDQEISLASGPMDQRPGVWLAALRCSTCANPAPPALTVLAPCR